MVGIGAIVIDESVTTTITPSNTRRARITEICADGLVRLDDIDGLCEVLHTGAQLRLAPGDIVLVWFSGECNDPGLVLGRIGPTTAPMPPNPDELLLEAGKSLTLRVGEGSITIREDGKILIKGKELVSHAQRMNRIKGGAVSIN